MSSCSSNPDYNAKSTNVDSTNLNGSAPVEYGGDNPLDTADRLPKEDDTGRRANTDIGDSERQ